MEGKKKQPCCVAFANFHDLKTLTTANFKLPFWDHQMQTQEEMLRIGSREPMQGSCSKAILGIYYILLVENVLLYI